MRNKLLKIISFLILGIIIFIAGVYVGNNQLHQTNSFSQRIESNTASIMFDYGDGTIHVFDDIDISENTTLFNFLDTLAVQNNIEFTYENYGGDMGVFITSINNISSKNQSDRWWQYWVNNQYGKVGVSNYIVQPGDVFIFKFMGSQL